MRLKDRVAIVTGAARGIGQAYCLALAREGAHIVAADILSCAATVAKVQQAGGEVLEVTADVANAQAESVRVWREVGQSLAAGAVMPQPSWQRTRRARRRARYG
jgi:NAD(P)-dependent dehydrogenase (short-subunit alcohol dehydrogenase family)